MRSIRHVRARLPAVSSPALRRSWGSPHVVCLPCGQADLPIRAASSISCEAAVIEELAFPNTRHLSASASALRNHIDSSSVAPPVPTEADPFCKLKHLLFTTTRRGLTADQALAAVHPSALDSRGIEWPFKVLDLVLQLHMSPEALSKLLPIVTSNDFSTTVRHRNAVLRRLGFYVESASRTGFLIYIRPAVDNALAHMTAGLDSDLQHRPVDEAARASISRHHRFLRALAGHSKHSMSQGSGKPVVAATKLHSVIQEEMGRVVTHLLKELDRIPSGSSSTPGISTRSGAALDLRPSTLDALFAKHYLVPSALDPLMAHCQAAHIQLQSKHLFQAAAVAMYTGDTKKALQYLQDWQQGNRTTRLRDEQRVMVARTSRTMKGTLMVLAPLIRSAAIEQQSGTEATPTDQLSQGLLPAGQEEETDMLASIESKDSLAIAWSTLLTRAAHAKDISAEDLIALVNAVPERALCAHVVTPTITGLLARDDLETAGHLWNDLRSRHRTAPSEGKAAYLDAAALVTGCEVQFQKALAAQRKDPLETPIRTMDFYGGRWHTLSGVRGSVQLDAQTLNVLLTMCNRAGRPGAAFRLFQAARPRWGIRPDDISLTLLLDTARYCQLHGFDAELDNFRGRLRALTEAFTSPSHGKPSDDITALRWSTAQDEPDWLRVPVNQLLDGPRYSWRAEHGTVHPWEKGRAVFRAVVLGNWPSLNDVRSPLERGTGALATIAELLNPPPVMSSTETDFDPELHSSKDSSPPHQQLREGRFRPRPLPGAAPAFPHIIPSPQSWQAYIGLLGFHFTSTCAEEVPRALAWMRALGTQPTWKAMATALMYVGENEGPRRRVRDNRTGETALVRDEELLRAWLVRWLGEEAVPTEQQVAAFRRERVGRNRPLSA